MNIFKTKTNENQRLIFNNSGICGFPMHFIITLKFMKSQFEFEMSYILNYITPRPHPSLKIIQLYSCSKSGQHGLHGPKLPGTFIIRD